MWLSLGILELRVEKDKDKTCLFKIEVFIRKLLDGFHKNLVCFLVNLIYFNKHVRCLTFCHFGKNLHNAGHNNHVKGQVKLAPSHTYTNTNKLKTTKLLLIIFTEQLFFFIVQ